MKSFIMEIADLPFIVYGLDFNFKWSESGFSGLEDDQDTNRKIDEVIIPKGRHIQAQDNTLAFFIYARALESLRLRVFPLEIRDNRCMAPFP